MSHDEKKLPYASVWGDTVKLEHLGAATVLGIVLTLSFYFIGLSLFSGRPGLNPDLAKGYSMMIGVIGCVISGVISATLFRPKRVIVEKAQRAELPEILAATGTTLEEEREALQSLDAETLAELEELGLKGFLSGDDHS